MKNLSRVNYAKLLYVKILDTDQLYDTNVTFNVTCKCFVTFESSGCDYEKYFTYFEGIYIILTRQKKNCLIVSLRTFGSRYKLICSTNSSDAYIERGLLTVCLHSLYCQFVYTHVKTRKSPKKSSLMTSRPFAHDCWKIFYEVKLEFKCSFGLVLHDETKIQT